MKPKSFRLTTLKALAAAHTAGFTHYSPGPLPGFDWVVDGNFYHVVQVRNSRITEPTVRHACHTLRDLMTEQLRASWPTSRAYTRTELGLIYSAWICDADGDWLPIEDCTAAVAAIWPVGAPC